MERASDSEGRYFDNASLQPHIWRLDMRKMIALAIAGFIWRKLQSRIMGKQAVRPRRGYY
jgi:hypothetical protein